MMFKIFKTKYSEIQHQFIGIKGKKKIRVYYFDIVEKICM